MRPWILVGLGLSFSFTGKEEFIFDVTITSTGLIVVNNPPDHRRDEEAIGSLCDVPGLNMAELSPLGFDIWAA